MTDDATSPTPADDLSPWRSFLAWPGSTSLVTLISAALLLLGLYGVIEPSIGNPDEVGPRWQVLGTLAAYLGALLSGVWAMCRARAGNPDAVASAVVGAALAVGYGVVVHLLAADRPLAAAVAGAAGWAGLIAMGCGFARIARAPRWGALGGALAALYAWSGLWPVALAAITAREAERMPHAGAGAPGTDAAVMVWWTAGWVVLLAVQLHLLLLASRSAALGAAAGPFLARRAMQWVLALVAAAAAVGALAVQAHVSGLDPAWGDCLPHAAVLLLTANELAAAAWGRGAVRDLLAAVLPGGVAAVIALAGWGPAGDAYRGTGWAPALVGGLGSAPVLPLVAAAACGLLAWRRRSVGMAWGAVLSALLGLVAWDARHPLLAEGGCIAAGACGAAAWRRQRGDIVATAASALAGMLPGTRVVDGLIGHVVPGAAAALALAAGALLALAACRPAWVARGWARLAAWTLGLFALVAAVELLHGRGRSRTPDWAYIDAACIAGAMLLIIAAAWRRGDRGIALAAAPAVVVLAWPLADRLGRAWIAIIAAFALLGGAVGLAVRRARISRS